MVDCPLAFNMCKVCVLGFWITLLFGGELCIGGINREAAERRQMMLARVLSSEARERCNPRYPWQNNCYLFGKLLDFAFKTASFRYLIS